MRLVNRWSGVDLRATICCTRRLLLHVLLSSQIANRRKVELLIAIKDQARVPHEWKANVLVKKQDKKMAVSSSISLAASAIETSRFHLLQQRQFIRNQLLHPSAFVARVVIEPNRQSPEG